MSNAIRAALTSRGQDRAALARRLGLAQPQSEGDDDDGGGDGE